MRTALFCVVTQKSTTTPSVIAQQECGSHLLRGRSLKSHNCMEKKSLQFLPYGRSIGSWICLTHKTYTCHTVQNTIRYDVRFTGMNVRYTIFERVTMYNKPRITFKVCAPITSRMLNRISSFVTVKLMCTFFSLAGHLLLAVEECYERCYRLQCQANTESVT
jgi:hypothetical protein